MIKKFTEQDMQNYADYVAKAVLSNIQPDLAHWYAEWHKLAKKVIDLSVLIDSQIDVEGSNGMGLWFVDKLHNIRYTAPDSGKYECQADAAYDKCRPRMNHIHAWRGGECPLPEGFRVKVWWRSGEEGDVGDASYLGLRWSNGKRESDIIQFEVLGLADGYVMPWEEVSDE